MRKTGFDSKHDMEPQVRFEQILGVTFTIGEAKDVLILLCRQPGLLVVPSAPALSRLRKDRQYREALLGADHIIADSTLMALLWSLISGKRLPKLSGLEYFREFLRHYDASVNASTAWVMPSRNSASLLIDFMARQGVMVPEDNIYVAPQYQTPIKDKELLCKLEKIKPRHIMMGVGGGTQEPLGFYLKRRLSYRAAIHCIGAAIGFTIGDQVGISERLDRFGLGWLMRCISNPRRFVPRYFSAFSLVPMMLKFRKDLPC